VGGLRRLPRRVGRLVGGARWDFVAGLCGTFLLVAALLAVIVYLPQLAVDRNGLTADQLRTHQDNLRGHVLQGLGGLALLGTLYFSARTLGLNRRGQVTDRFGKAIEQLGSGSLAVRLGGIYALEQIAFDSADLHWPVMEVLCAYLREHAPAREDVEASAETTRARVPADHRAIATVIGRRRVDQDPEGQRLDLGATDLSGLRWNKARLENAFVRAARLERANLSDAHLDGADLRGVRLKRAYLQRAYLNDADLRAARLEKADLKGAYLQGTDLGWAHVDGADFGMAHGLTWEQLQSTASWEGAELPAELAVRLAEAEGSASREPVEAADEES
jgi:hypothetical protein